MKSSDKSSMYEFAILDNKYNVIRLSKKFKATSLNKNYQNISNLFRDFDFSSIVEICFLDHITKENNLYIYFHIIGKYLNFNVSFVSLDEIPRRICNYHRCYKFQVRKFRDHKEKYKTDKFINRNHMNHIFNRLLETEKCPWINKEIYNMIKLKPILAQLREIRLRMALYYMLIKRYLYKRFKESKEKSLNSNV